MERHVEPYDRTRVQVIGQGGMGVVHLRHHLALEREVAMKEIRGEHLSDEEFVHRFDREARTAARLQHQNIVCIYDYWSTSKQRTIVMEYVNGTNLRRVLYHRGALPPILAVYLAHQIACGLGYAHRHGFVHRDVKPSNLLISRTGEVKISDFGVVKVSDASQDLTGTGAQIGTSQYMAPEQIEGKKGVNARADVFSLGIVLYEMLAGRHPFGEPDQSGQQIGSRILKGRYAPLRSRWRWRGGAAPHVPFRLDAIVRQCLRNKETRRYQDMAEVEFALSSFLWRYDLLSVQESLARFVRYAVEKDEHDRAVKAGTVVAGEPPAPAPDDSFGLPPHESRARRRLRRLAMAAGLVAGATLAGLGYALFPVVFPRAGR